MTSQSSEEEEDSLDTFPTVRRRVKRASRLPVISSDEDVKERCRSAVVIHDSDTSCISDTDTDTYSDSLLTDYLKVLIKNILYILMDLEKTIY